MNLRDEAIAKAQDAVSSVWPTVLSDRVANEAAEEALDALLDWLDFNAERIEREMWTEWTDDFTTSWTGPNPWVRAMATLLKADDVHG